MARRLEGRPLAKSALVTSLSGRDSKGGVEKINQITLGGYYVTVKNTMFRSDKRERGGGINTM